MPIHGFVDFITRGRIQGWVLDDAAPDEFISVSIVVNGQPHGHCVADRERPGLARSLPAGASERRGFVYDFATPLPAFRTFTIDVVTERNCQEIAGGHRILHAPSSQTAGLMPVLVSSRGRSGTTLLMNRLKQCASIVIADAYPFEVEFTSYYASALKVLISYKLPGSRQDPDFVHHASETSQIGRNPWNTPDLLAAIGGVELQGLFTSGVPSRLMALFRDVVLDAYRAIANTTGKRDARFFAEKCSLDEDMRLGIRNLMGDAREIVMIRDPRDFVCSARSFWNFDTARALTELKYSVRHVMRIERANRPDTLILRYEDLIREQRDTLLAVFKHIGIVEDAVMTPAQDMFRLHATSSSPETSINRWKSELSQSEVDACVEIARPMMEAFNYPEEALPPATPRQSSGSDKSRYPAAAQPHTRPEKSRRR